MQGMCDDAVTVEQFCRRYVEPMGEESDHVHIVALTDALQVFSWRRTSLQSLSALQHCASSDWQLPAADFDVATHAEVPCCALLKRASSARVTCSHAGAHPSGVSGSQHRRGNGGGGL